MHGVVSLSVGGNLYIVEVEVYLADAAVTLMTYGGP
jgi:hypothetical protein